MSYYFNKMCQGSLFTITMLLTSVSICAVVVITKLSSKASKQSSDISKHATQRTMAQNISFTLSQEIEKIARSNGSTAQPFITSFVNNGDPSVVGTRQETPTDPSALNIAVISGDADQVDILRGSSDLKGRATSADRSKRNKIGYHSSIINKAIPSSPTSAISASRNAGGYYVRVDKVYPDPTDNTHPDPADNNKKARVVYALAVQSYACNDGEPTSGFCNSSGIMGDYSVIIYKKRTCPVIGGTQLIVANDPGKDFYNLNCTCPTGKTIQANGTCTLRCSAGQFNNGSSCEACLSGQWAPAGSTSCTDCSGCGTSAGGGTCDPTQGCTSCPGGRQLSGNSCILCNAGTSAAAGANICTPCAAGTYSSSSGASSCQSCTSAYVTACSSTTGGATSCNTNYQLSSTSGAAGTTCIQSCPNNCQSCSSSTACTTCNSGWYVQPNGSCAQSCPAGTYISNGVCVGCSSGQWSAGGTVTSCNSCYTGAVSGSCTSSSGNSCVSNATASGTRCECNGGYTWDGSSSCIINCPSGSSRATGTGGDAVPGYSGCYCLSGTPVYITDSFTRSMLSSSCRAACGTGQKFCSGTKFYTNLADITKTWNMGYGFIQCADCTPTYCSLVDRGVTYYTAIKYCIGPP